MFSNVKFTPEEKLNLFLKYYELKISLSQFYREFNVERIAIVRWLIKYEAGGPSALNRIKIRTEYSSNTLINSLKVGSFVKQFLLKPKQFFCTQK
ncbi:MAG: hypothetical protein ACRC6A_08495 [Fusobacteriaceae bacterium]